MESNSKQTCLKTLHNIYQMSKLVNQNSNNETQDRIFSLMNADLRMTYPLTPKEQDQQPT